MARIEAGQPLMGSELDESTIAPEAGIVDYKQVCRRLAERVRERDGRVLTSARVTKMERNNGKVILRGFQLASE